MNPTTVFRLAVKDLYLLRLPLAIYVGAGALAVALAAVPDRSARSLGVTLAMNVFIAACFQLVIGNVLGERERKTLAFTLSLPVSPRELTAGKLLSSVSLYTLCGVFAAVALMALAPAGVVAGAAHDGRSLLSHALAWLPYVALVLGGFLVPFATVLATAVVTESLGWTITVSSSLIFVLGNGLIMFGPRLHFLGAYARNVSRGGPALPATIVLEAALLVCILAVTFWLQDRKRSFV
jgi:ABC-type Na+ efflux pump permease subunit